MISFSLEKKIALVTGASRGIGEAVAMGLTEYGATCILVSRNAEALEAVKQNIKAAGGKSDVMVCNMGHIDQIQSLFEKIRSEYGRLDILINNAATNPYFGEMINAVEQAWDKTVEVNVKGPFFMIQHAAKLMEENGGGAIVNVASVNGISPAPMQGIYSITKAAMISMTKAYAKELAGKNIRVNALLPGLTKTRFASALFDKKDLYNNFLKQIPMHRHAEPEEMVGAILYLVSQLSSYTTGTTIVCDGGALA